jgi:hypothetical protein
LPGPSGNGGGVCWLQAPIVEHSKVAAAIGSLDLFDMTSP